MVGYSLLLTAAALVSAPWWLFRMFATRRYREGLGERLGRVPGRTARPGATELVVWLHAVSVGEVLAAGRLIDTLRAAGCSVYISTTTRTGQALARQRFGPEIVFYYPLDFAFAVRTWLAWLRPRVVVLMESEFWPRMLVECAGAGVPVAVVNARISDRSWPRYRRLSPLWRPLLATLSATLAQSERDAERLRALGAARTEVIGNLKFDVRPPEEAGIVAQLRRNLPPGAKVIVCGSTLEGEEALLVGAIESSAFLCQAPGPIEGQSLPLPDFGGPAPVVIVAPRHPERFDAVAGLLSRPQNPSSAGRRFLRRSTWMPEPIAPGTVLLLDSIGELASVYALADLACVGGSWFPPGGGHNPLEPALFGVPVVTGPYTANFTAIIDLLQSEDAIAIADEEGLRACLLRLLSDGAASREMGLRARRIAEREAGASARAAAVIERLIGEPR